jgi:glycine/serine hydroxymethyltransferase
MKEGEFESIATLMSRALRHRDDEAVVAQVRADVAEMCATFNPYANFTK